MWKHRLHLLEVGVYWKKEVIVRIPRLAIQDHLQRIELTPMRHKRIYPNSIVIRNGASNYGLKNMIIEGSSSGIKFHDWLEIGNISNKHSSLQRITVNPLSGYVAWKRAYKFFMLKLIGNHGGYYNEFYEFRINGLEEK